MVSIGDTSLGVQICGSGPPLVLLHAPPLDHVFVNVGHVGVGEILLELIGRRTRLLLRVLLDLAAQQAAERDLARLLARLRQPYLLLDLSVG